MKKIDTIEEWNRIAKLLQDKEYSLFQMQYGIDSPEGFHAWFIKKGGSHNYEVVTFNQEVHDGIVNYK